MGALIFSVGFYFVVSTSITSKLRSELLSNDAKTRAIRKALIAVRKRVVNCKSLGQAAHVLQHAIDDETYRLKNSKVLQQRAGHKVSKVRDSKSSDSKNERLSLESVTSSDTTGVTANANQNRTPGKIAPVVKPIPAKKKKKKKKNFIIEKKKKKKKKKK